MAVLYRFWSSDNVLSVNGRLFDVGLDLAYDECICCAVAL